MATQRKRLKLSKKLLLIFAIGLLAGIYSGVVFMNAISDRDTNEVHSQNEVIEGNGFELELLTSRIEQFEEPNSGMKLRFVIADVDIVNTGDSVLPFIPVFQSHVRNSSGITYDMSPFPDLTNPIIAGDIEPGANVSGQLSYLIADEDQDLLFIFDSGWNQQDAIFIKL